MLCNQLATKRAKIVPYILLVTICFSVFSGCSEANKENLRNWVFAWTEGFLASPVGEERTFALTFYSKDKNLQLDAIDSIQLDGMAMMEGSSECYIEKTEIAEENGYYAYAVICTYTPEKMDNFQCSQVTVVYDHCSTPVSYPFGQLYFEVGEPDSGVINTWESVAASSNSSKFAYSYFTEESNTILTKIKYAPLSAYEGSNGLDLEGNISLDGTYDAPVVLIMSKLWSCDGQRTSISYGKGCYCGSFGSKDSILSKSLEHWAVT